MRSAFRTVLFMLDARKPLAASISRRIEELRIENSGQNLTISNPGLIVVSSNASPG
jgi:hypothetical protein